MKNLFMLGTCHIWTKSDEWLVYKEFKESFSTKTEQKIAHEHIRIYYIINVVNLVHVSAIFREVLDKGYIINASKTNAQICNIKF